jgi:hypothetical protein
MFYYWIGIRQVTDIPVIYRLTLLRNTVLFYDVIQSYPMTEDISDGNEAVNSPSYVDQSSVVLKSVQTEVMEGLFQVKSSHPL